MSHLPPWTEFSAAKPKRVAIYRQDCRKLIEYIAGILKISQETSNIARLSQDSGISLLVKINTAAHSRQPAHYLSALRFWIPGSRPTGNRIPPGDFLSLKLLKATYFQLFCQDGQGCQVAAQKRIENPIENVNPKEVHIKRKER